MSNIKTSTYLALWCLRFEAEVRKLQEVLGNPTIGDVTIDIVMSSLLLLSVGKFSFPPFHLAAYCYNYYRCSMQLLDVIRIYQLVCNRVDVRVY